MKRKILFFSFLFFVLVNLFAWTGPMSGQKNLRVSKTEWFDIIYAENNKQTAAIVFEHADELYRQACAQYGFEPSFRMPVVITPSVEMFNAFWTSAPYNHIVIYDTTAPGDSEINVFSETLLGTLYHELTHAVTYNMKNGFWTGVGKVFGDAITPGSLLIPSGMAEGATVASESLSGEGRLNNEYTKQYVKQAKIEGKFPSYYDYYGNGAVVPVGGHYYFNGEFAQWTQQKYGLQAYANFWYNLVNLKNLTVAGSYKKAFGVKLKTAWKQFEEEYQVLNIPSNPVKSGLVQDFFKPSSQNYSIKNNSGAVYDSLTASSHSLAWIDSSCSKVYLVEKNQLQNESVKPKVLFTQTGISKVSLSQDGRLLAVSYYSKNSPGVKAKIKIYDIEKNRFYEVKGHSFQEASIIQKDSDYYLVCNNYEGPLNNLYISKIVMSDNKVAGMEEALILRLKINQLPFCFQDLQNGTFAYIKKDQLTYSIVVSDLQGNEVQSFAFSDEKLVLNSLSYADGKIYFSWASTGTMPHLGTLDLQSGSVVLNQNDYSGGIYSPVLTGNQLVYVGHFYRQNRLFRLENSVDGKIEQTVTAAGLEGGDSGDLESEVDGDVTPSDSPLPSGDNLEFTSYNPLKYMTKGIFIPVGIYTTAGFGTNVDYSSSLETAFAGATYITANPWTSGTSDLYVLTGGWNYFSNSFGTALYGYTGTATSLLQSAWNVQSEFDGNGFKQAYGSLQLSSTLNFGTTGYVSLTEKTEGGYGRQNTQFTKNYLNNLKISDYKMGMTAPKNNEFESALQQTVSVQLGNIHYANYGRYAKSGVAAGVVSGYRFDYISTVLGLRKVDTLILSPNLTICLPQLLPFDSLYGFTYNLPVTVTASLLPSASNYGYSYKHTFAGRSVIEASAETVLFAFDVQKGIPFCNVLFLNDFFISAGYTCSFTTGQLYKSGFQIKNLSYYMEKMGEGKLTFLDGISLKAGVNFRPNIGISASTSYMMKLYGKLTYAINRTTETTVPLRVGIGFDTSF